MSKFLQVGGWVAALILAFGQPAARGAAGLFGDEVLVKGKGLEVRRGEFEEAYIGFKGSRAALGQAVPPGSEAAVKAQILEKLVATKLFLTMATAEDRKGGLADGEKFIAAQKAQASSEASFQRQLLAAGTTYDAFAKGVVDQAVVKQVIDRVHRDKVVVTEADERAFHEANKAKMGRPEQAKVSHILISTRDLRSGVEYAEEVKLQKRRLAEQLLERAKKGEDFRKLARENSDDFESKAQDGMYTFPRGGRIPPEFEAAAFSLKPDQISDVVRTVFGYHIIKLYEVIPAMTPKFEEVRQNIQEELFRQKVQEALPAFLKDLREKAEVKVLVDLSEL